MFQSLESLRADPILGIMAAYRADSNPNKIDLGIGVYKDENGNTPIMSSVKKAEDIILNSQTTKSYVGPTGAADYNATVAELLFGKNPVKTRVSARLFFMKSGNIIACNFCVTLFLSITQKDE